MNTFRAVFLAYLLLISEQAFGQDNLCSSNELAVFSCRIGHKIVSLCATADLSETAGTLLYRFGSKSRIEIVFPETSDHPKNHFKMGLMDYSDSSGDFIRFERGDYLYTLYSWAKMPDPYTRDGVEVRKNSKLIADLRCNTSALLPEKGWEILYNAKLPSDSGRYP